MIIRVAMGEVVDIDKDFTTHNLSLWQKVSVIWQSMVADSKILRKRKHAEEEKEIQRRNEIFDALKDGMLASLVFHLQENKTLDEFNQQADELQLAIERAHMHILDEVLKSYEFNVYEVRYIQLDPDLVNSFGETIPIIVSFRQKEVWS